jgi:hypothetical protein
MALVGRKRLWLGVIVVVLAAVVAAWRLLRIPELARIGAGYVAEQTCACLFIGGRTLQSCLTDLEPTARKLVSVQAGAAEVTARSPGAAPATARYEPGFGCSLRD